MSKVAIIGAGSMKFTRQLFQDMMTVPELIDTEFSLTDIDHEMLELSHQMLELERDAHGLSCRISSDSDRRRALADADYVMCFARIGGLEMWRRDCEIPMKYGVDVCIGDTLGPSGILYGQRGVAAMLEFCRDIREVAKPGTWLINYMNPMSIITWAASAFGGVNVIGLCHGVQHTTERLAEVLDTTVDKLIVQVGGVNHMCWFTDIRIGDRPVTRDDLLRAFDSKPHLKARENCRIDLLRRTGCFNTESNGFSMELTPWYRKRPELLDKWVTPKLEDHHDSGISMGGVKANLASRESYHASLLELAQREIEPLCKAKRTVEHSSYIIEAMETDRIYRGTLNVPNHGGCIENLPEDAMVEVPCYVDRHGVSVPHFGKLPEVCASICGAMVSPQRLAVRAAIEGDRKLLKQAVMMDPLAGAACSTDEISDMVDEMLEAGRAYLPQYFGSIPLSEATASV